MMAQENKNATSNEEKVKPNFATVVGDILKNRTRLFETIRQDKFFVAGIQVLFAMILFFAIYGFVMVMHIGTDHALWIALKLPIVFLASVLLTMPTLYVFSSIRGTSLNLREMFTSALAGLGLTSIIMIALIPIVWLFAYSNASEGFLKFLNFMFIFGSLIGGFITTNAAFKYISNHDNPGAKGYKAAEMFFIWAVLYLLVFAQMTANFGPFFTESDQFVRKERKNFFVVFFSEKDTDNDGLSDRREKELGTSIKKKDTDGDGRNDKYEVDNYMDPKFEEEY